MDYSSEYNIDSLFHQLIRVSIGTQKCLSRIPTEREWGKLYMLAKKQSLIGICFAGLQQLVADANDGFVSIGMSEALYLTWMGMTAEIQSRGEVMNRQCIDLQRILLEDGFRSCILKGQGVAALYNMNHGHNTDSGNIEGLCPEVSLGLLRQTGDIDIWLWCEGTLQKRRSKIIKYALRHSPEAKAFVHHIDCKVYGDTETELHYLPSWFHSPVTHHRFVKWCESQAEEQMNHKMGDMTVPTISFNSVYLLIHIYRHLFQEGIGLRQLLDYYWVLKSSEEVNKDVWMKTIVSFRMKKFASAVMWIEQAVFGLDNDHLLCEPDSGEGVKLLNEIMEGGNFGQYDRRNDYKHRNMLGQGLKNIRRNSRFLFHYPSEVLWSPIWKIMHWWLRTFSY